MPAVPAVLHDQGARDGTGSVREPAGRGRDGGKSRLWSLRANRLVVHAPDSGGWAGVADGTASSVARSRVMTRAEVRTPAPKATTRAGRRGRVLIIDDEDVLASTIQEFLEGEGYVVAAAPDAPTALERVQEFEP